MTYFRDSLIQSCLDSAELVAFDFNGLMVDDEFIQLEATNEALKGSAHPITPEYWVENCVGRRAHEFLLTYLKLHGNSSEQRIRSLVLAKERAYERLVASRLRSVIRPGVLDLLKYLRDSHPEVRIALATSSTRQNLKTAANAAAELFAVPFDVVVTGDDVLAAKPSPEIYLRIRERFPETLVRLAFEDSASGVVSAIEAGFLCIAVPNEASASQSFSRATLVISDLTSNAIRAACAEPPRPTHRGPNNRMENDKYQSRGRG